MKLQLAFLCGYFLGIRNKWSKGPKLYFWAMVKWASLSALVVFEGKQKAHLIKVKVDFSFLLGRKAKKLCLSALKKSAYQFHIKSIFGIIMSKYNSPGIRLIFKARRRKGPENFNDE